MISYPNSSAGASDEPPRDLLLGQTAFFFDFDGVLVDIAPTPDVVSLDGIQIDMLRRLAAATINALAIVSGREIADIDRYLGDFRPAVSGGHGAEWRGANGETCARAAASGMEDVRREVAQFADEHSGLIAEPKRNSVALHFRNRPELKGACAEFATDVCRRYDAIELLYGKMVVELKTAGTSKGAAIRQFMGEPPFIGRMPVFVGDDVTDEDGFLAVNELNGITIKLGSGTTTANFRLDNTHAFWNWLRNILLE